MSLVIGDSSFSLRTQLGPLFFGNLPLITDNFFSEMIALLGHRDNPTDGVEDYCRYLSEALEKDGYQLKLVRVPWAELGWPRALRWLWRESDGQRGQWTLVQYTALSWSRRGFPLLFLVILLLLKFRRARLAVVFHDSVAWPGRRFPCLVRRTCQHLVMRLSAHCADRSILPVPPDRVAWLPANRAKVAFIPVGANLPTVRMPTNDCYRRNGVKTIGVFGITDGGDVSGETAEIAFATKEASRHVTQLRLVTMGRGSQRAAAALRQWLKGASVEFATLGLLSSEEVSQTLAQSDVVLFVRGGVSSRRASAIAAIACGIPLVAYSGPETGPPVTEAGVVLVPWGDRTELARAVVRVLTDSQLWEELHRRSLHAQEKYFSWNAIADEFERVLVHG